jgi:hypothetical protein
METSNDHQHPLAYLAGLICSVFLALMGELAGAIKAYNPLIEAITLFAQWFAWTGAGMVGVVTIIKWLQDNEFLPKRKKKK